MPTPRWSTSTKRVVLLVLAALVALLLWRTGDIVAPFIWAGILAYILIPLVNLLERRGLSRGLSAAVVFACVLAAIISILRFAVPLAFAEIRDLQRSLPRLIENAHQSIAVFTNGTVFDQLDEVLFVRGLNQLLGIAPQFAVPFVAGVGRFLLEFLIFLVGTFFFLRDGLRLRRTFTRLIPQSQRGEILPLLAQVSTLLGHYVRGQLLLVVIMATATTISLTLFALPYAFVLGIITGVLETIPIVGPITAGAIAVLVALGHQNPFGWTPVVYAALIAIVYTVLRHTEDYFVIPLVIGRIVRLHPAIVIFSLLAGGSIAGLLGILLAVPAAATARLVLIYISAKLRDKDPFPQIEEELASTTGAAGEAAREPRVLGGQARP